MTVFPEPGSTSSPLADTYTGPVRKAQIFPMRLKIWALSSTLGLCLQSVKTTESSYWEHPGKVFDYGCDYGHTPIIEPVTIAKSVSESKTLEAGEKLYTSFWENQHDKCLKEAAAPRAREAQCTKGSGPMPKQRHGDNQIQAGSSFSVVPGRISIRQAGKSVRHPEE
ncbi:hypothetical protein MJT46_011989 [Ovis ammon polii x Ovis aries]|nr:hypothetical protein MJT46_011989 [Ovis ammon polii x Ovis aries]